MMNCGNGVVLSLRVGIGMGLDFVHLHKMGCVCGWRLAGISGGNRWGVALYSETVDEIPMMDC